MSLPLGIVLDVYSVRAEINSELNGGRIAGFEDLVHLGEARVLGTIIQVVHHLYRRKVFISVWCLRVAQEKGCVVRSVRSFDFI